MVTASKCPELLELERTGALKMTIQRHKLRCPVCQANHEA